MIDVKKPSNQLQTIFLEHVAKVKEQVQQRVIQRGIENAKSQKSQLNQKQSPIQLNDFKPHDKRNVMERFFSDPRVVNILASVFRN